MAIASGILGIAGILQQRRARKEARRAEKVQERRAELQQARQRRQQIVQARRQRAAALAEAEASGVSGGSQIQGAVGSLQSQVASNLSFLNQLSGLDRARFGALSKARDLSSSAQTFQAASGVAGGPFGQFIKEQFSNES